MSPAETQNRTDERENGLPRDGDEERRLREFDPQVPAGVRIAIAQRATGEEAAGQVRAFSGTKFDKIGSGCLPHPLPFASHRRRVRDMPTLPPTRSGDRYGRLTVLSEASRAAGWARRWNVQCDCGKQTVVYQGNLRKGHTRSCGCIQVEVTVSRSTKHGCNRRHEYVSEYGIWAGMTQRCRNPKSAFFSHYGGRGITICERWLAFENFLADMGRRPSSRHSLDRKNNDGHYSCGCCPQCIRNGWDSNCRWGTLGQQSRNRRNTRILVFRGIRKPLVQWAEEHGLKRVTLASRIDAGWDIERALITPVRGANR